MKRRNHVFRGSLAAKALVLFVLAVGGALVCQWYRAESPSAVVDRAGQAIKNRDWKTVYGLVAWSDKQREILDEGRFMTLASVYEKIYMLEDYRIGAPRFDGETALVPVTVKARVSGFFDSSSRTETADVRCIRVKGTWRITPDAHNGLIGAVGSGIAGL